MGASESKMAVPADAKPQPVIKKTHVSHLIDPRSPSAGIDRSPIQESSSAAAVKSECPLAVNDPRSPTFGITRTPVREIMRGKYFVSNFLLGFTRPQRSDLNFCFFFPQQPSDPLPAAWACSSTTRLKAKSLKVLRNATVIQLMRSMGMRSWPLQSRFSVHAEQLTLAL
uniref:Uncharacterized protein n=1 Tax=Xiphophorus couchianus TaxID=32473 RepID=A0A3B5MZ21_9TELE